ncbi:RNA polymerase sigma factor SigI [Priestia megaterium]|uniref:RNA polymerase sigma factor SigI n=1 Tax=Priestia megaterium TaxID=1404 RepID=UPI000BF34A62|nr:RNA polymerase sigma factor SigI [Priestia megaterium]MDC7771348.1 RNA polymerase sigma factor SigI [Priestia megaterium]PEU72333.1 RNA polymerase sigma-I factor [Priestia megaterium]PFQ83695.1 RNA polymerase sigma-I factor [Priestia megaterium]PFW49570.1 RNA polymerase sigma-I factor [Priestia megaterium]PGR04416.1 RNA polymerase sigma-I factor [Priestia megaterium]
MLTKVQTPPSLETLVLTIQQGDKQLHNEMIQQYKPFIAKVVSAVCKRYISEADDEFSIGLIAFNEAIENYTIQKGRSLLAFAELIIKRRVIDYIRKEKRNQTLLYNRIDNEGFMQGKVERDISLSNYKRQSETSYIQEEITYFCQTLELFKLTLEDIINTSPKHKDARGNAVEVASFIVNEKELRDKLFLKRQLPIRLIEKHVKVSRKTIERNRKYIIAMVIILAGDYVYLKDYIM